MTDEVLRDREQPGSEFQNPTATVQTTPDQLFEGHSIGLPTGHVLCNDCQAELGEGRAVTVYGYRVADSTAWELQRCYCANCAPSAIQTPTLGVTELLVHAWLGTLALPRARTHRLCLTEVECNAYSPPSEGASA